MFKSVEYAGFDNHPELRRLAERGTTILPDEIEGIRDTVRVEWVAHPGTAPALELDLAVEFPGGRGRASRCITLSDFSDDDTLRTRLRRVWVATLSDYLERRKPAWDALIHEPLEV